MPTESESPRVLAKHLLSQQASSRDPDISTDLISPVALNIVYMLVEKKQGIFIPELYHDPKNWHFYLGTSQVSWVSKDKSELVIILILVNDNSIHPDAYPRNVGIILDTLFSSLMTSYFWPWSIDHTCSTSLRVRVHCSNNSKILVVEDCKESTRALPDSAGLILKMQVKFRSMACITSFQTRVMEHHHHH